MDAGSEDQAEEVTERDRIAGQIAERFEERCMRFGSQDVERFLRKYRPGIRTLLREQLALSMVLIELGQHEPLDYDLMARRIWDRGLRHRIGLEIANDRLREAGLEPVVMPNYLECEAP